MSNNQIIQCRYQYSKAVAAGDDERRTCILREMKMVIEELRLQNAIAVLKKAILKPAEIALRILSNISKQK